MKMKNVSFVMILALLHLLAIGCAKRPEDMPPTYPAKITILRDGKPVPDAQPVLFKVGEQISAASLVVSGVSDSDGVAVLHSTYCNYTEKGVPEGEYKVVITCDVKVGSKEELEKAADLPAGEQAALFAKMKKERDEKGVAVPPIWASVVNTPLKMTVEANQENGGELTLECTEYYDYENRVSIGEAAEAEAAAAKKNAAPASGAISGSGKPGGKGAGGAL